jgi:hypothetical protein
MQDDMALIVRSRLQNVTQDLYALKNSSD